MTSPNILPKSITYKTIQDSLFPNGTPAMTTHARHIANAANFSRGPWQLIASRSFGNGQNTGLYITTKTIAYPTDINDDCLTRCRVDLPQDLSAVSCMISFEIMTDEDHGAIIAGLTALHAVSGSDAYASSFDTFSHVFSVPSGTVSIAEYRIYGTIYPNKRLGVDIGVDEELWLNFYCASSIKNEGSTYYPQLLNYSVYVQPRETMLPDFTNMKNYCIERPLFNSAIESNTWKINTVTAQDQLFKYETSKMRAHQGMETSATGFLTSMDASGNNFCGIFGEYPIYINNRDYLDGYIQLLVSFWTSESGLGYRLQTSHNLGSSWDNMSVYGFDTENGWNRLEINVETGECTSGYILIRVIGLQDEGLSTRTAGFGVKYFHNNIMNDIV